MVDGSRLPRTYLSEKLNQLQEVNGLAVLKIICNFHKERPRVSETQLVVETERKYKHNFVFKIKKMVVETERY